MARTPLLGEAETPVRSDGEVPPCPFCRGSEQYCTFTIASSEGVDGWDVRVIPNRVPLFSIEGSTEGFPDGIYDTIEGVGAHEIAIDSPRHFDTPYDYTPSHWQKLLGVVVNRLSDLKQDSRFKYISYYRNYGSQAGAHLEHPHSQILALPFVPFEIRHRQNKFEDHMRSKERCFICDIIHHETSHGQRILTENESFLALAPYASRYPFEVHIYPREHREAFESTNREDLVLLSHILYECHQKLHISLSGPPLQMTLYNRPRKSGGFHWSLELVPLLLSTTAITMGTGVYVNPVTPEQVVAAMGSRSCEEIIENT
nr:DUF4931 domain-containing protein [Desulfurispira natronophila]